MEDMRLTHGGDIHMKDIHTEGRIHGGTCTWKTFA